MQTNNTIGMIGPATPVEWTDYRDSGVDKAAMPPGIGGTPVNLLTRELLRRGRRVVLFTLDRKITEDIVLRGPKLTVHICPWRNDHPARDLFAAERRSLAAAVRKENVALLHAQWTYEYALAAQSTGLPTVITAHDAPWNVLRHNPIPYRMVRTVMAYQVLSRARRVVGVAPYVADHLRRYMLYRGPRLVIPNGMPESLFEHPAKERSDTRGTVFAASLVGWSGRKNSEALIEAFARVRATDPDSRLILFGSGHGAGEPAEAWSRERGMASGIEFVGQVSHAELLRRLAAEVHILVHPALEEAQPMALIEAMAMGIPVIAGKRSGGVPWTLDDGRAGVLVDVTHPEEIADQMLRLAADEGERRRWGEAGRRLAVERFHIRSVADAWEAQYEELLAQRR